MGRFKVFNMYNDEDVKKHLHLDVAHDKQNWPGSVVEISDVVMNEIRRSKIEKFKEQFVNNVLLRFVIEYGTVNLYLPSKEFIRSFLSDYREYIHLKANKDKYNRLGSIKDSVLFFDSLYPDDPAFYKNIDEKVVPLWRGNDAGWTYEVVYIIDAINKAINELSPQIKDDDRYLLIRLFLEALSFLCCGRNFYVSSCLSIKKAIRDELVFKQFNGLNQKQLARAYNLSPQLVYEVHKDKAEKKSQSN